MPTTADLLYDGKDKMNSKMCKSILSTQVLDYPSPVMVNYKQNVSDPSIALAGGTHLAKISGISNYLGSLDTAYDDDLAMIFDVTDTWFQLPPDIMISRYYEMIEHENALLAKRFPHAPELQTSRKVFFSVQKGCGKNDYDSKQANAAGCKAAPESSLPKDIFGAATDQIVKGRKKYQFLRPRWVNSGFMMGPVVALRAIFERAEYMLVNEGMGNIGSDQFIFTEILGQQEVWRKSQAQKHASGIQDWLPISSGGSEQEEEWSGLYNLSAEITYELGIALDASSRLSQVAWSFESELAWITHNDNRDEISKLARKHDITSDLAFDLPSDVNNTAAPFSALLPDDQPTKKDSWSKVELVTNLWTGEIPASVHLCGPWKARIDTHWNRLWVFERIRQLLNAAVLAPVHPIATTDIDGERREWYGREVQAGFLATDRMPRYTSLGDVCGRHWKLLMGDDGGPWENPLFQESAE